MVSAFGLNVIYYLRREEYLKKVQIFGSNCCRPESRWYGNVVLAVKICL